MLKQLIQRLLDSRTTPEEAGHSAMPSASETVLLTQNDAFQSWGNIYQGVAADDGYVNIFARSVNNTTSEMRVLTSGMTFSSAQTEAEKDMACSAPVAKGQTYTIKGIQVKMIKIIFVKALGAIWGGYNGFVRRAVLCLKPSFSFSPRSFCKAKNNGSAAKPFLIQELNSVTQQEGMLLQRTDTSVSSIQAAQEAVCFLTSTQERIQMCHRQIVVSETVGCLLRTLTWGLLSLLKKECQSILRRIQSQSRFGSAQQPVGADLRTGGALC